MIKLTLASDRRFTLINQMN